jgi:hypothetical protein
MMDGAASLRVNDALLLPDSLNRAMRWGSGGLAGVWASKNTREALFDAMLRKETFATSGPRISVRFFGGWHFTEDMLQRADVISLAYEKGVAMGGVMSARDNTKNLPPVFMLWATKDPDGANLDRIQVIKLWVDEDGRSHEKVFDVAASDGRQPDGSGRFPPVGNTVNAVQAGYANTIGAVQLSALWTDPEFDAGLQAAYFARVLEIPTPRWSTYDARTLNTAPIEPVSIQERAVTSAIWYRP